GGAQAVTQGQKVLNLRPVDATSVESQTEPAARADIGRQVEAFGCACRAVDVFAECRFHPHRDDPVAMMAVELVRVHLPAHAKVGMIARDAAYRFREFRADRAQFGEPVPEDRAPHLRALMNCLRRKRSADQSSSMATMRTESNPACSSTLQPLSRLNS